MMQIITDNGSNYKKACKMITHKYQICVATMSCLYHQFYAQVYWRLFKAQSCD
jgi:hypothetical protein